MSLFSFRLWVLVVEFLVVVTIRRKGLEGRREKGLFATALLFCVIYVPSKEKHGI